MIRLFWRLLPIFILLYIMQGTAAQYVKYIAVAKHASRYAITYLNLASYVPALYAYYEEHERLPPDLADFLRSHFTTKGSDPARDAWDNPYELTEATNQFSLKSCGMDRTCPTEDDLSQSASKTGPSSKGAL